MVLTCASILAVPLYATEQAPKEQALALTLGGPFIGAAIVTAGAILLYIWGPASLFSWALPHLSWISYPLFAFGFRSLADRKTAASAAGAARRSSARSTKLYAACVLVEKLVESFGKKLELARSKADEIRRRAEALRVRSADSDVIKQTELSLSSLARFAAVSERVTQVLRARHAILRMQCFLSHLVDELPRREKRVRMPPLSKKNASRVLGELKGLLQNVEAGRAALQAALAEFGSTFAFIDSDSALLPAAKSEFSRMKQRLLSLRAVYQRHMDILQASQDRIETFQIISSDQGSGATSTIDARMMQEISSSFDQLTGDGEQESTLLAGLETAGQEDELKRLGDLELDVLASDEAYAEVENILAGIG